MNLLRVTKVATAQPSCHCTTTRHWVCTYRRDHNGEVGVQHLVGDSGCCDRELENFHGTVPDLRFCHEPVLSGYMLIRLSFGGGGGGVLSILAVQPLSPIREEDARLFIIIAVAPTNFHGFHIADNAFHTMFFTSLFFVVVVSHLEQPMDQLRRRRCMGKAKLIELYLYSSP